MAVRVTFIAVSQYHQEKIYRNSCHLSFTPPFLKNKEASTLSAGTDSGISCRWLSFALQFREKDKIVNKKNQDYDYICHPCVSVLLYCPYFHDMLFRQPVYKSDELTIVKTFCRKLSDLVTESKDKKNMVPVNLTFFFNFPMPCHELTVFEKLSAIETQVFFFLWCCPNLVLDTGRVLFIIQPIRLLSVLLLVTLSCYLHQKGCRRPEYV